MTLRQALWPGRPAQPDVVICAKPAVSDADIDLLEQATHLIANSRPVPRAMLDDVRRIRTGHIVRDTIVGIGPTGEADTDV